MMALRWSVGVYEKETKGSKENQCVTLASGFSSSHRKQSDIAVVGSRRR
jgi:hypothetical protein